MPVTETAVLHVPAREIPIPPHLSPEAQAVLAMGPVTPFGCPPLDDPDAWRRRIAEMDQAVLAMTAHAPQPVDTEVEEADVGGARVFVITPPGTRDDDRRVYIDLHGGAFMLGGGDVCRHTGLTSAARLGARTWSVDYRMPPDHPFPAALDDCVAVYRTLLRDHRPEDVIVGGGSAGGNLTAALILRARDEGLPLPAAAIILTPAADLTNAGDTWHTNFGIDPVIVEDMTPAALLYADGRDLSDPYISPLFGDFGKGFPPTLLGSGTRDVLLSDTVRLHRVLRAANVPAELHVLEAAPHGWFFGMAPEDAAMDREIRRFADTYWQR
jgi:acetyl esterase/lipase